MNPSEIDRLAESESGSNVDWVEYFRIIIANIWLIASITGVVAAGAALYFSSLPNKYTASAKILVGDADLSDRSSQQMLLSGSDSRRRAQDDYYGTQIAIMTGRRITSIVRDELPGIPEFAVTASREPRTRLIRVSVTQRDPRWAADIANKFAQVFVRESNRENDFIGEQMLQFIPENIDAKDIEFVENVGVLQKGTQFSKKEYAESLSAITGDSLIQKLRTEKVEMESKLVELLQRYKPNHPNVKDVQQRLEYTDTALKERMMKVLTNIRANLKGTSRITNIKVLEEALPPSVPSWPNRTRGVILWTLFGMGLSLGLVFLLEHTNQRIRIEKDFEGVPLPFLGNIPLINDFSKMKKKAIEQNLEKVSLVELIKQNPVLADSIANVRTHILFSMPYEKSKRIMLTSCIPDEGKTTVSTLLSLSLTALGRKILLIDADMRRPFAHNYIGIKNRKGLSDYLTGQATIEEVVQQVPGSELKVISAGSPSPNPSELVASDRFREILEYGSDNFDRVVIDVPPVLFIPDGLIVAKHVHSGVLICGSGMVHKKTVRSVKQKFDSVGHSFIGIILNKVNYDKGMGKYRYYKSYKSYYSKSNRLPKKGEIKAP